MKRVIEAFHIAKGGDTRTGIIQIVLVLVIVGGTMGLSKLLRLNSDTGPGLSGTLDHLIVDVTMPEPRPYVPELTVTGLVEARATVALSPQVGGRVVSVHPALEPGSIVPAGEALFTIDPTDYELAVNQAEAEVAAADANLLNTRANAENYVKDWYRVYPDQAPPALVAKEPQIKAAEARLQAARAVLDQAKLNLSRTGVTLSFPARVIDSQIERGQLVTKGASYGALYATDSLRVRANIEPKDIGRLGVAPGQSVLIEPDLSTAAPFEAPVASLGGILADQTRLQAVILALPADTALVPGSFIRATVRGPEESSIFKLPLTALTGSSSVWKVSGGQLLSQAVSIVDMTEAYVFVHEFDPADGVVVSQVPTSFVNRPVKIRAKLKVGDAQ